MMRSPKASERNADGGAVAVFGAFTLLGVLYILVAKGLNVSSEYVTIVPVLLMIAYACMIQFAPGLRLRTDQTADNFYYMGFIYTLVSLGMSLYQYSSGGSIDGIIRNFGIAIASTITGIVLRIMFNQMRRDPIEIEHVSRLELADAARKVRREMDGVIYEIAHFRRTNQQMVQEMFDETKVQLAAMAKSATSAVDEISASASKGVEGAVQDLVSQYSSPDMKRQIDQSSKSIQRLNTRLEESANSLASAAGAFASRLEQAQSPDKVVEVQMQPVIDGLQKAITDAMTKLNAESVDISSLRLELGNLAAISERTNAELGKIAQGLADLHGQMQGQQQRRTGFAGLFRTRQRDGEIEPSAPDI